MARRVEVDVDGARATFALLDDWTPTTAGLVWDLLPLNATAFHAKLSGDACYFLANDERVKSLPVQPEVGVTSIYRGYMVANPHHDSGELELLIAYGVSEYRWPTGRRYLTPVAQLQGDGEALFDALRRTQREGTKPISVRKLA